MKNRPPGAGQDDRRADQGAPCPPASVCAPTRSPSASKRHLGRLPGHPPDDDGASAGPAIGWHGWWRPAGRGRDGPRRAPRGGQALTARPGQRGPGAPAEFEPPDLDLRARQLPPRFGHLLQRLWLETQGTDRGEAAGEPGTLASGGPRMNHRHPTPPRMRARLGSSHPHEAPGARIRAGAAPYIDDLPELAARCTPRPSCPPVAHGRLQGSMRPCAGHARRAASSPPPTSPA